MRAPVFVPLAFFGFAAFVKVTAFDRRQNALDSCTQTDLNDRGYCIDSALSVFSETYQNGDTSSFDYSAIASEINNLQSGLTSFGVTLTSFLPDPSSFVKTPQPGSTYAGPFVSDIVSSYSQYTETRTDSSGSVFSFETSAFTPESRLTSTTVVEPPITSSARLTSISSIRSASSIPGQPALATSSVGGASRTHGHCTGFAVAVIFLLSIKALWFL